KLSQKALAGASAVGLITMPHIAHDSYFRGGRAVERLWLTAAERHLAIHPMTALAYMLSQQRARGASGRDNATQATLNELHPRFGRRFSVLQGAAGIFLFRVSYGEDSSERSLRRRLDDVLVMV